MAENSGLRRVLRKPAMRAAFGVGNTKLDELEAEGIIPKRFPLWPGSIVVGWDEQEVIEAQRRLAEARAKQASDAEAEKPPQNNPPRPNSALLKAPRKAVRR